MQHDTHFLRHRPLWLVAAVVILATLLAAGAPRARAATTYTVCPTGCDFDNVLDAVTAAVDGDTIDIAAGTYDVIAAPIQISKDLTLRGAGVDVTTLQRAAGFVGRVLRVDPGVEVLVEDMTITGGWATAGVEFEVVVCTGNGASGTLNYFGRVQDLPFDWDPLSVRTAGAKTDELTCEDPISASASTSLFLNGYGGVVGWPGEDNTFDQDVQGPAVSNATSDITLRGGGIYNEGDLTLRQVKVSGNSLTGNGVLDVLAYDDTQSATATAVLTLRLLGGGIYNAGSGSLRLERSTVSGNTVTGTADTSAGADLDTGDTASATANSYVVPAGGIYNEGLLTLIDSTISDNTATTTALTSVTTAGAPTTVVADGVGTIIGAGGVANAGSMTTFNSTISGNTLVADDETGGGDTLRGTTAVDPITNLYAAGGVFDDRNPSTLNFSTIADNTLTATIDGVEQGDSAGGVVTSKPPDVPPPPEVPDFGLRTEGPAAPKAKTPPGGNLQVFGSLVTGNTGGDCAREGTLFVNLNYSLSGDGSCDIPQGDAGLGPLANNGGPTETHLPSPAGDAIDLVPTTTCASYSQADNDQRGEPRPLNDGCEAGSVEVEGAGATGGIFVSAKTAGAIGGLDFGPEDILMWDGAEWSIWFDGSAAGLTSNGKAAHNINAFFAEPSGDFTLMSFAQNRRSVPGVGLVDGMDLVIWNGSYFILVFDGQDVGLTNKTQEKIDAVHVLPGAASPIGSGCQVYLLISTQGPGKVPNYSGGQLKFGGEDVLGFCVTANGDNTSGLWHMVLDGSAQGMPRNSTDSISMSDDGQTLYLTTKSTFSVDSATGGHSMIYAYDMTTEQFSGPLFVAADNGLDEKVDGLQVQGELP